MQLTALRSTAEELEQYDQWVRMHPEGSLWQSLEWKAYQEAVGREVRLYQTDDTSALVQIDRTSLGLTTWEIPRGPLYLPSLSEVQKAQAHVGLMGLIEKDAQKTGALSLSYSPSSSISPPSRYRPSGRLVYPEATRIVDLTPSEEDILGQMKQKGRYNIRLASKKGVSVRRSDDIDAFWELSSSTKDRDGFIGPLKKHYEAFLHDLKGSFLLLAYTENEKPIAGLLGVIWGSQSIYYYGASDHAHRALMAPYLLQWEAIRHCKSNGCTSYDLFGIAPPDSTNHPWAGISHFKEKFRGAVVVYPPEMRRVLRPFAHTILSLKRKIL